MRYNQCLWYALNKWHLEGGYIRLRRSVHWCIPHVLHEDNHGILTHFAPPRNLLTPLQALIGFRGTVLFADPSPGRPVPMPCIFVGTCILMLTIAVWAAATIAKGIYDTIFNRPKKRNI